MTAPDEGSVAVLAEVLADELDLYGHPIPDYTARNVARELLSQPASSPPLGASGDDGPCQECGQPYPCWRAPDDLWNLVLDGPDAKDDPGGMLCPNCFLRRADVVAPVRGAWVVGTPVRPERVVAAEALREAADEVLTEFDPPIDGCIWASEWLRDRAEREAGE